MFSGQNNFPFRGADDTGSMDFKKPKTGEGTLRRLLRFRIQSGDEELKTHIQTAPRNACYTSGEIQNNIIRCIGDEIREKVFQE